MMKKILAISFMVLLSSTSHAFDTAYVPFDKALRSGQLVFVGFVSSVSVTDKSTGEIQASATILVEECLVGGVCKKGEVVNINYFAQVTVGTSLPLRIPVGNQVMFSMKQNKSESAYNFDSDINNGTDFGYVCDAFPYSMLDVHSKYSCKDLMTGKEFKDLSLDKIMRVLAK